MKDGGSVLAIGPYSTSQEVVRRGPTQSRPCTRLEVGELRYLT